MAGEERKIQEGEEPEEGDQESALGAGAQVPGSVELNSSSIEETDQPSPTEGDPPIIVQGGGST